MYKICLDMKGISKFYCVNLRYVSDSPMYHRNLQPIKPNVGRTL